MKAIEEIEDGSDKEEETVKTENGAANGSGKSDDHSDSASDLDEVRTQTRSILL